MNIFVIGGGGREHALCWKLAQSSLVEKLYCAPGNAGIAKIAECVDIKVSDLEALAKFAEEKKAFTVVGPEAPLCDGIVDIFLKKGLKIFGPGKNAAMLEGSKAFSKAFMEKFGIPTASAKVFIRSSEAVNYIGSMFEEKKVSGLVIKADGLAAGKGVILAYNQEEAVKAVSLCFEGAFGDAGRKVLIEELLSGEEVSILAFTDGKTIIPLASSQDHKRVGDGDTGPNTGGMGAYSPAIVVSGKISEEINEKILQRFLNGIKAEKLYYRGIIYAGIILTSSGPKTLEFNVRFGDPETQAVLMRLESDLADTMLKTTEGRLNEVKLKWTDDPSVCVVMASGGYPDAYEKGFPISGLADAELSGAVVFHAGTALKNGAVVSAGGRVLGVTARAKDIKSAIEKAYKAVRKISWQGCFYRNDIAGKAKFRL